MINRRKFMSAAVAVGGAAVLARPALAADGWQAKYPELVSVPFLPKTLQVLLSAMPRSSTISAKN